MQHEALHYHASVLQTHAFEGKVQHQAAESLNVALSNEICFPSAHNATPYHNIPTSKSDPLNETVISKTFPSSSKNSNLTVMMTEVKPRLIRKKNPSPLLSPPMEMPLCPLKMGSPMTCCKHLSHIGPPWPNGLPGLPDAGQHCLFADTVLPGRTCGHLKTMSKVCQRNEPVCSRVSNPRSTGSTVICHPTCLLERLAQPNYCVSVTIERSTDVGDVAMSKHR